MFGNTRQAYYEKLKYISKKVLTSEIILSLVKDTRIDFPRMGANKMLFHLRPKLYSMGLDIGRDAFVPLLAENHLLVTRRRSKRKHFLQHRFISTPICTGLHTHCAESAMGQ